MMRKWKYPAAALLLGAALALWPAGTAEASALTGLSMEYTREETEYARAGTAGRIPDARAAAPEKNPGETLPVSAASNASDGNAAVKKTASNASDGNAAVKKAASALRGHQDPVSLSGASIGASEGASKEVSKESGEKKQQSKFQLPQFLSDNDFHFDSANEKKELGKAISKLDELGISPEKLVVRFWDFITHKENLEKIGKTAHDLKENAGELIEQATGGNGDSGDKSGKSGSEDSGNTGDSGRASAEKDNGSDIDRVKDKVKEEVDRKTEEAIDKAAETAGEIAAREIDKAAETAGQLVGQEIDKAAEKVKEEVGKSKK